MVASIDPLYIGSNYSRQSSIAGYTAAQLQQLQEQLNEMRNVEAHPV